MSKHMSNHMCLVTHLFNHMSMQMSIWPSFVCVDACELAYVAFLFHAVIPWFCRWVPLALHTFVIISQ